MDLQPRSKNGQPPHRTTGVLRSSCSHEVQRGSQPTVHRHAEHRQHGEQQNGHGQNEGDPKSAGHVPQFGIVLFTLWLGGLRLQVHAALRACSRSILLDFRVHRTGVDDLLLRRRRTCGFQGHAAFRAVPRLVALDALAHRAEVFARPLLRLAVRTRDERERGALRRLGACPIGEKLLAAMLAAKIDGLAVPLGAAGGRFIDGHAANGIDCHEKRTFPPAARTHTICPKRRRLVGHTRSLPARPEQEQVLAASLHGASLQKGRNRGALGGS